MYQIVEVSPSCRKDLMKFIKFPDELYKGNAQYVPALHSDQVKTLTRCASLDYCTHKLWMVMDGKKVVGRICAMINPRYNERYNTKRVRFGWFDTINDIEVARLLIDTASAWAKSQGMNEIHGPLFFNTLGKQGMLVEGFENIPPFNCIYNYPYYVELIEALGFTKECDWLQYKITANNGIPDKASRVADIVQKRYNLHFGSLSKLKKDPALVKYFFDVYNKSFSEAVYNFIPFTDKEIEEEAAATLRFVNDKVSCIIFDENEKLVAFAISFPTMSKALQKAKGKLFPFGWIHLLKAMNDYSVTDLMINGAVPEWQNTGVSAMYYKAISAKAIALGNHTGITNPQIETNSAVNIWRSFENEPFMRRRCYIKTIE